MHALNGNTAMNAAAAPFLVDLLTQLAVGQNLPDVATWATEHDRSGFTWTPTSQKRDNPRGDEIRADLILFVEPRDCSLSSVLDQVHPIVISFL